jgi:ectoine hydroxylase-related dioxygenase (phytanoyl-CoA dioxygenase family)
VCRELHQDVHPEWVMSLHQVLPGGSANWVWQLATAPALLDMLEMHLGPNLVLFSTQLAVKPPGSGWRVPWHQDGERCRTVWIPLDNVDSENGALQMLHGWHKRGRQRFRPVATEAELDSAEFFQQYHLYASDIQNDPSEDAITCTMPAGAMEIHHPLTPHASAPNGSSSRTRRAILMRYQPSTEPITGGTLVHWKTGKTFTKANYLVRGHHPHRKAGVDSQQPPSFVPLDLT